jgi:hypothetical protein
VVSNFTALPASVTVGQTGSVDTITAYHDSTMTLPADATQVNTYTVVADTPTTLQVCTTSTITATPGNQDQLGSGVETDCFRVDANGNATLFSITLTSSGVTVTFN